MDGFKSLTICLATVAAFLLAPSLAAQAQEAKPARIGYLGTSEPSAVYLAAFHKGMRDRGHIEGKTYILIPAWGKAGSPRAERAIRAKRLVKMGVDVIITGGSSSTRVASRIAPSTPIVIAESADPVRAGLIESLAKPGGNVTGVSSVALEANVKGMEILKQLMPGLRRIGAIHILAARPGGTSNKVWSAANKRAAERLGIEVIRFHPRKTENFDALFARVVAAGVGAISIRSTNAFSMAQRTQLVQAAIKASLPNTQSRKAFVKPGGFASVGPNYSWIFRRVAAYVDLILKGAKPADLPVEEASQFDLTINLKTAKALGIAIPTWLLLWADEVIE